MAIAWLGEVLIALSRSVHAYHAVQAPPQQPALNAPQPAGGDAWRWFGWVRGAQQQPADEDSVGDGSSGTRQGAGGDSGRAAGSSGRGQDSSNRSGFPSHESSGSGSDGIGDLQGGGPIGVPGAMDRQPSGQMDAEAEAELLRAVGVVPSFARAVAAELRAASDRAGARDLNLSWPCLLDCCTWQGWRSRASCRSPACPCFSGSMTPAARA